MSTGRSEEPFRALPPRLARGEALAFFSRRRGLPFFRPAPGRLELVYLPMYLFEAAIAGARGPAQPLQVVVDAVAGAVARLDHRVMLREGGAAPGGDSFPPLVGVEGAQRALEAELPWMLLPVALRQRRRLSVEGVVLRERIGYPYWVQHIRRRAQRDFRALDGFSGTLAGPRGRAAIVQCFLEARSGAGER
jgi:hypothetical protein